MSLPSHVNIEQHQHLRIKDNIDFEVLADRQFAPLCAHEFAQAASSYPVVMLKDGQSGVFVGVGLWGFQAQQNVLFNANDNSWNAVHLPNDIQCAPFSLAPAPDQSNTLSVHINVQSPLVQTAEGHALFDQDGETAYLKSIQSKLAQHYQHQVFTRDFINLLLEKNLLKEIEIVLAYQDERIKRVKGLYTINEEALAELDEATIVSFFKRNLFVPIYAMLGSLTQFNRLMKLYNQNEPNAQITRIQMRTPDTE